LNGGVAFFGQRIHLDYFIIIIYNINIEKELSNMYDNERPKELPISKSPKKVKQQLFIHFMLSGMPQVDAYWHAGFGKKTQTRAQASACVAELLKKEEVIKELEERLDHIDTANRARLRGIGEKAIGELLYLVEKKQMEDETKLSIILEVLDRINLSASSNLNIEESGTKTIVIGAPTNTKESEGADSN